MTLIRRVLFSRSLRLMPLPQQVGVIEGLALLVNEVPSLFPLADQHLLAFLSELLKMSSVADGEMADTTLTNSVVDKNGYVASQSDSNFDQYPSHASALFFRRECVAMAIGKRIVIPEEMPVGVQLRVSSIALLHAVIRGHSNAFFDAETASPVGTYCCFDDLDLVSKPFLTMLPHQGNIRPHVVSLLFRSLVSNPVRAVDAAHFALRDVLSLSIAAKTAEDTEKSPSRLPKELLQTCIRPVLLHLRDYTRLSIPLLRGLSRLLALLSSWFNKTLGEKLLDHLQKWTDPIRITAHKIWKRGEEPRVAAAIVDIFGSLPHASHFVEPLVKTCIKLEATLSSYKARFVLSPYRKPLARYLSKHPQFAVSFFFQRLKTPMYSELFQHLVEFPESDSLRSYLNNKQCSIMLLNVCFERPLAIIRSEKSAKGVPSSLSLHGILSNSPVVDQKGASDSRPMNTESLELQLQGFRLVDTLMSYDADYFQDHNDIVRALRWLWRSKGRFLRLQHEDLVSPRYHGESCFLAAFLTAYAKSFPNEDLDILFELIRIFLQTPTTDFLFVGRFLADTVSYVLNVTQKKQVIERFFSLIAGETSEETKVLR
jgi:transformation/transcription domain-associated protein